MFTIGQLLFNKESGGKGRDPANTLFGHAQMPGGAFEGMRPSEMTLGELHDFQRQRGPGSYFEWVKQNNKGVGSTPAGSIQLIGDTLGNVMQNLNLDRDAKFDVPMQMKIGRHLIDNRLAIARGDPNEELRQLRNEWAGFKDVSDPDLKAAIMAYKEDPSTFGLPGLDNSAADPAHKAMMGFQQRKTDTPLASFSQILEKEYHERGLAGYELLDENARIEGAQMQLMFPKVAEAVEAEEANESGTKTVSPVLDPRISAKDSNFNVNIGGDGGATNAGSNAGAQEPAGADKIFGMERKQFGDLLAGLGVGLGQMSHGQPVNMMPTIGALRQQRLDTAENERAAKRQEMADRITQQRATYEGRRVAAEEGRLALATAKEKRLAEPGTFNPADYAPILAANKDLKPVVEALSSATRSGNTNLVESLHKVLEGSMNNQIGGEAAASGPDPQVDAATAAFVAGKSQDDKAAALAGLSDDQAQRVFDAAKAIDPRALPSPDALARRAQELEEAGDVEGLAALDRYAKLAAGVPTESQQDYENRAKAKDWQFETATENASVFEDQLTAGFTAAQGTDYLLQQAERANNLMLKEGVNTGSLSDEVDKIFTAVSQVYPGITDALVERGIIPNLEDFGKLNNATKMVAFELGRSLLADQGSVTENERKLLFDALINTEQTPETRRSVLNSLRALNAIDQVVYRDYKAGEDALLARKGLTTEEITAELPQLEAQARQFVDVFNKQLYPANVNKEIGLEIANAELASMTFDSPEAANNHKAMLYSNMVDANAPTLDQTTVEKLFDVMPFGEQNDNGTKMGKVWYRDTETNKIMEMVRGADGGFTTHPAVMYSSPVTEGEDQ